MNEMMKIRRASFKERLHFLLTGEIPGYWSRARMDIHRTYLEMLNSESEKSPFYEWPADSKKELLDFFNCSKISYEQARPFLRRHFKGTSLTPDYFPGPDITEYPPKPVLGKPGSGRHYYPWDNCKTTSEKCPNCSWKSECPLISNRFDLTPDYLLKKNL